ncbi:MAG: hypothetical protein RBR71_13280 [Gudongella sp.]|jgi:hypothetical protein|nr:hypothetical protein [Gudongella sp.]
MGSREDIIRQVIGDSDEWYTAGDIARAYYGPGITGRHWMGYSTNLHISLKSLWKFGIVERGESVRCGRPCEVWRWVG